MGQLMVHFKLCIFKWENQLQTVIWAMKVSRLVKTRKYCCRNKIAFRKHKLFFKTFFAILRNTGFCLQHMQAKKRKHIGNHEETVTLSIWYGKFSHLYAVTTPTKIPKVSICKCEWGLLNLATDLYLGSCLHCHRSFCKLVTRVQKPKQLEKDNLYFYLKVHLLSVVQFTYE